MAGPAGAADGLVGDERGVGHRRVGVQEGQDRPPGGIAREPRAAIPAQALVSHEDAAGHGERPIRGRDVAEDGAAPGERAGSTLGPVVREGAVRDGQSREVIRDRAAVDEVAVAGHGPVGQE